MQLFDLLNAISIGYIAMDRYFKKKFESQENCNKSR